MIASARQARDRIAAGIELLRADRHARLAFRAMNEAVARAARQRDAGARGDPAAQRKPTWRPFQLAFILLNSAGLAGPLHADREIADLLFFPTGGGKTEAYLGLAAWTIAHRRLTNRGVLGAGVAVLMRYTLRLLTLDQLSRAAGVVCALELMRGEPAWHEGDQACWATGRSRSACGSAPTRRRTGSAGPANGRNDTAVARVRRYRTGRTRSPGAAQGVSMVRDALHARQLRLHAERHCAAEHGDPLRQHRLRLHRADRPLPVLTVDEPIYRRLPAFLIATVDKFAGLPWVGETGAFFGTWTVQEEWASTAPLNRARAASFRRRLVLDAARSHHPGRAAPDQRAARDRRRHSMRRRSIVWRRVARAESVSAQGRCQHRHGPTGERADRGAVRSSDGPGFSAARVRTGADSFFARTVPSAKKPARLYLGLAAPGRGPKLIFLRALTTLLAAGGRRRRELHGARGRPVL